MTTDPKVYRGFSTECVHAIAEAIRPFLDGHPGWHHFSFEVKLEKRGVDMRGIRFGLSEPNGWTWRLEGAYTPAPEQECPNTPPDQGLG